MLENITTLVPHGDYSRTKELAKMYLANMGDGAKLGTCNYLVLFYEQASPFSQGREICKTKLIESYDRMASSFAMLKEVYSEKGWMDFYELRPKLNDYGQRVLDAMAELANP